MPTQLTVGQGQNHGLVWQRFGVAGKQETKKQHRFINYKDIKLLLILIIYVMYVKCEYFVCIAVSWMWFISQGMEFHWWNNKRRTRSIVISDLKRSKPSPDSSLIKCDSVLSQGTLIFSSEISIHLKHNPWAQEHWLWEDYYFTR